MSAVPLLTLNNGRKVPQLALGTFCAEPNVVGNAIEVAIDAGYRHIDGAHFYQNEKEVGEAIVRSMKKHNLKREDLFITSKLWCDKHDPKDVRGACEKTLRDLGVGYLDLYLIHWPVSFHMKEGCEFSPSDPDVLVLEHHKLEETWKAMEELMDAGLVKSVGVSNFNKSQLERICKAGKTVPVVNQVEVNLHCLNTKLIDFCHSKGIIVEGYAPFGSPGFLPGKVKSLFEEPNVVAIARKHGKTPAQVLIRHGLQRGIIVLNKSTNPERIRSNFEVFDFELTQEEMDLLNKTGSGKRIFDVLAFSKHPEYPFNDEY